MDYVYVITYYILTYIMYYVKVCVCIYIFIYRWSKKVASWRRQKSRFAFGLLQACSARSGTGLPPTFERELHKNGKLFVQHVQQNPAATAESLDRGRNGLVPGRGGKVLSAGISGALLNSGNSSQTTWGSLVPLLLSPRGPHRNCFPVENNCFFLGRLTIFNTPGLGDRVRQHGLEWSLGALWKLENSKSDTPTTTFISVSCSLEARVCEVPEALWERARSALGLPMALAIARFKSRTGCPTAPAASCPSQARARRETLEQLFPFDLEMLTYRQWSVIRERKMLSLSLKADVLGDLA